MPETQKLHPLTRGIESAGCTGVTYAVLIGLSGAIVSVAEERPRVLAVHRADGGDAPPFGTFDPLAHRPLESGLRNWVAEQTRFQPGYFEQLYNFAPRRPHLTRPRQRPRGLPVGHSPLNR